MAKLHCDNCGASWDEDDILCLADDEEEVIVNNRECWECGNTLTEG
jgi:ribosomal protein S27AE